MKNVLIAILTIIVFAQAIAMPPSQAQTIPPCATATRRPTRTPTPEATATATPTPTIGEPVMIEYDWMPLVGGQQP